MFASEFVNLSATADTLQSLIHCAELPIQIISNLCTPYTIRSNIHISNNNK
jgi:hypothetical protein